MHRYLADLSSSLLPPREDAGTGECCCLTARHRCKQQPPTSDAEVCTGTGRQHTLLQSAGQEGNLSMAHQQAVEVHLASLAFLVDTSPSYCRQSHSTCLWLQHTCPETGVEGDGEIKQIVARDRAGTSPSHPAEPQTPGPAAGEKRGKIPHPDKNPEHNCGLWILSEVRHCLNQV